MGQAASGCLAQAIQSIHVSFALAFVEIWVISGSFLRICSQFPKVPTFIEIPVVSEGGSSDWEMMKVPILDPHRVLHYVHETVGIRIAPDLLEHYWKTAARNGLGWATSQSNMRAVPIGLYADETKYGLHESQEKVLAVFLNMVLFRPKNIRLSRFLIFTLRSRLLLPDSATLYPLFRHIVWSLGWASKGIMPDVSMSGGPLPADQARHALKPLVPVFMSQSSGEIWRGTNRFGASRDQAGGQLMPVSFAGLHQRAETSTCFIAKLVKMHRGELRFSGTLWNGPRQS